ncbi:hypothetical protein DV736_g1254, partial [Chaetothyriales sp. CBS 134916]
MSFPPPPGLGSSSASAHPSLPARPPPSNGGQNPSTVKAPPTGFKPAFTTFAPRQVASAHQTLSPAHYAAAPVTTYGSATQYHSSQLQPQTYDTSQYGVPDIKNPFVPTSAASGSSPYPDYDPEYEAQVAQWQSAYVSKEGEKARLAGVSATVASTVRTEPPANKPDASQTVHRSGGGQTWNDQSLLEWDPAHFRIFVGNLAGEVTDDSLLKAFSKYPTVQKAKVIRDKRTTKSKGFGFVSFKNGDDYFQAAREMQGKYIGSHPVLIKKSTTEIKPDGIRKKNDKTKGGLRVLG